MAASPFAAIILSLFLFQTSHGSLTKDTFRHLFEEKVEEAFKDLVQPVITEVTRLNQTLISIEKFVAKKKLPKQNVYLFDNTNKLYNEDSCKNLTDYLPKAEKILENALYLCTDISGALSGIIVDGFNCINIDILKTVSCLLNDIKEIEQIYEQYEPEIKTTIHDLRQMIVTLYKLFEECIKN